LQKIKKTFAKNAAFCRIERKRASVLKTKR